MYFSLNLYLKDDLTTGGSITNKQGIGVYSYLCSLKQKYGCRAEFWDSGTNDGQKSTNPKWSVYSRFTLFE